MISILRNLYRHVVAWRMLVCGAMLLSLVPMLAQAGEIRVAVASNFADAFHEIAARFTQQTGHRLVPVIASSGKHYAQIINGAPFEVFLAADSWRPQKLESAGHGVAGSRFTYAVGKLVLWSPASTVVDAEGQVLHDGEFRYLSIANPRLAPYGKAAEQVLRALGLFDKYSSKMVRGENIAQAYQFVKSGNAELGLLAYSQILQAGNTEGSYWLPPASLYDPIEQQALLLKPDPVAREFLAYLASDSVRELLVQHFGYGVVNE